MNRDEILKKLSEYNFDKNKFYIISGAALVLLNFIDSTKDIDISVDEDYFNQLLEEYNCIFERKNEFGESAYIVDNLINFGISFKPNEYVLIDGYKVASLEECYKVKVFLNREKDKALIKKLKSSLEK